MKKIILLLIILAIIPFVIAQEETKENTDGEISYNTIADPNFNNWDTFTEKGGWDFFDPIEFKNALDGRDYPDNFPWKDAISNIDKNSLRNLDITTLPHKTASQLTEYHWERLPSKPKQEYLNKQYYSDINFKIPSELGENVVFEVNRKGGVIIINNGKKIDLNKYSNDKYNHEVIQKFEVVENGFKINGIDLLSEKEQVSFDFILDAEYFKIESYKINDKIISVDKNILGIKLNKDDSIEIIYDFDGSDDEIKAKFYGSELTVNTQNVILDGVKIDKPQKSNIDYFKIINQEGVQSLEYEINDKKEIIEHVNLIDGALEIIKLDDAVSIKFDVIDVGSNSLNIRGNKFNHGSKGLKIKYHPVDDNNIEINALKLSEGSIIKPNSDLTYEVDSKINNLEIIINGEAMKTSAKEGEIFEKETKQVYNFVGESSLYYKLKENIPASVHVDGHIEVRSTKGSLSGKENKDIWIETSGQNTNFDLLFDQGKVVAVLPGDDTKIDISGTNIEVGVEIRMDSPFIIDKSKKDNFGELVRSSAMTREEFKYLVDNKKYDSYIILQDDDDELFINKNVMNIPTATQIQSTQITMTLLQTELDKIEQKKINPKNNQDKLDNVIDELNQKITQYEQLLEEMVSYESYEVDDDLGIIKIDSEEFNIDLDNSVSLSYEEINPNLFLNPNLMNKRYEKKYKEKLTQFISKDVEVTSISKTNTDFEIVKLKNGDIIIKDEIKNNHIVYNSDLNIWRFIEDDGTQLTQFASSNDGKTLLFSSSSYTIDEVVNADMMGAIQEALKGTKIKTPKFSNLKEKDFTFTSVINPKDMKSLKIEAGSSVSGTFKGEDGFEYKLQPISENPSLLTSISSVYGVSEHEVANFNDKDSDKYYDEGRRRDRILGSVKDYFTKGSEYELKDGESLKIYYKGNRGQVNFIELPPATKSFYTHYTPNDMVLEDSDGSKIKFGDIVNGRLIIDDGTGEEKIRISEILSVKKVIKNNNKISSGFTLEINSGEQLVSISKHSGGTKTDRTNSQGESSSRNTVTNVVEVRMLTIQQKVDMIQNIINEKINDEGIWTSDKILTYPDPDNTVEYLSLTFNNWVKKRDKYQKERWGENWQEEEKNVAETSEDAGIVQEKSEEDSNGVTISEGNEIDIPDLVRNELRTDNLAPLQYNFKVDTSFSVSSEASFEGVDPDDFENEDRYNYYRGLGYNADNFKDLRNNAEYIIIHTTATSGPPTEEMFTSKDGTQLSAHFVIDTEGKIYQYLDPSKPAYAVGAESSLKNLNINNLNTLNIEFVNDHDSDGNYNHRKKDGVFDRQIAAGEKIMEWAMDYFPKINDAEAIKYHGEVAYKTSYEGKDISEELIRRYLLKRNLALE